MQLWVDKTHCVTGLTKNRRVLLVRVGEIKWGRIVV